MFYVKNVKNYMKENKYNKSFLYAIIIVFLDILSTYIFLKVDCGYNCIPIENNPFAAYIIHNFGFIGLSIISAGLLYVVYKYKPVLVYSFIIVNTITTFGNVLLILKYVQ